MENALKNVGKFGLVPVALRQKQWLQSSRKREVRIKTRPTEFIMA